MIHRVAPRWPGMTGFEHGDVIARENQDAGTPSCRGCSAPSGDVSGMCSASTIPKTRILSLKMRTYMMMNRPGESGDPGHAGAVHLPSQLRALARHP